MMKKQLRKFPFTLVEVLIAMGICVVGVVSIMGLFPVGANAARDASMAFYADQAADQMLHFTKYVILKDTSDSNVIFKALTGWTNVNEPGSATAKPDDDEPDWADVKKFGDASASGAARAIYDNITNNYMTMLASSGTEIKCSSPNLYRLGFITRNGGDDIEDFACVVRLWPTPIHVDETDNTSDKLPRAATFHLEVSWPADLPYNRRQKAEYSMDVFVPEG